jgi:hypothetical protein
LLGDQETATIPAAETLVKVERADAESHSNTRLLASPSRCNSLSRTAIVRPCATRSGPS